jgi:uncharacterized oxidoreductase
MPKISASEIRKLEVKILTRLGAPTEYAELVADMLVEASLVGHDSHGAHYITRYAERIKKGIINPKAVPEVTKETASTAIIDGHWGFGQVTAKKAVELAIGKARKTSVSAVGATHCNHIGRLGAYTTMVAENDMIGFLMANVVHPTVQPYGGASRVLGSNPISVAAPTSETNPFLLDFATSAVAEGKVGWVAMNGEKKIPLGWIVDNDGHDTDNPLEFSMPNGAVSEEGRLLSFGARDGHKGYALSILMEILGGILPGAGSIADQDMHLYENGLLAIVLDVQSFTPITTFRKRIDSLIKKVHAEPVQTEFRYDRLQVPGEFEWRNRQKRLKEGIDIPAVAWEQIIRLAEELKITPPEPARSPLT